MKGKVNIAKVDATANAGLKSRFELKGFPTLKFFSGGKVYAYAGARNADAFEKFLSGGYKEATSTTLTAPSATASAQGFVSEQLGMIIADLKSLLATKKNVLVATLGVGALFGGLLALIFSCVCGSKKVSAKKLKKQ